MMKIGVTVSPHQRRRLHNGHSVRVKKGEGILLVNPANFGTMSKTFLRNKAKEIRLTPAEIEANKLISPEAHNYNRDEVLQPPTIAPKLTPINSSKANVTGGRISNAGGTRGGFRTSSMGGLKEVSDHLQRLEDATGLDLGDQLKSGLGNLIANMATASMGKAGIEARKNILGGSRFGEAKRSLQGRGAGQIGVSGNLLANSRVLPPALQSQPFSENWAMANQLPPQYHKFNRSI